MNKKHLLTVTDEEALYQKDIHILPEEVTYFTTEHTL